jgi:hydroxymethylpyrimidine pyrophosphatase-like HAD family hydrolase
VSSGPSCAPGDATSSELSQLDQTQVFDQHRVDAGAPRAGRGVPDVADPAVTLNPARLVAGRCLIASDIDRTLLSHEADEAAEFFRTVAPHLVHAAQLGTRVAVLTGNSVHQLVSRFLDLLVQELCHCQRLELLGQFHFFCSGAGVYAHFPVTDPEIRDLLEHSNDPALATRVLDALRCRDRTGSWTLRPRFVNSEYLERCRLDSNHGHLPETEHVVLSILREVGEEYVEEFASKAATLARSYDLSLVTTDDGILAQPHVDVRSIQYGTMHAPPAIVQMTLKPVLSNYMRLQGAAQAAEDPRTMVVSAVQTRLDSEGLGHIVARPGGRSSIDIALRKVDKAYALSYLIDRLNVQGQSVGERFGSQTIYFGDEITVGTGNDYAVTRIQGLTVFAVNGINRPAPFLSSVFEPFPMLSGPQATALVLQKYNEIAQKQIASMSRGNTTNVHTAVDILKRRIFGARIDRKLSELRNSRTDITGDDWQGMHAYITLLSRPDRDARGYLATLRDLLDMMLRNDVEARTLVHQLAAGSSHPDWE